MTENPELSATEAAVALLPEFEQLAQGLRPRDRALQDDIIQEVCLAVLLLGRREAELARPQRHRRAYWLQLAEWRARDFLHVLHRQPVSVDPRAAALICESLGAA